MTAIYVIRAGLRRGHGTYWNPFLPRKWRSSQECAARIEGRELAQHEADALLVACRVVRLLTERPETEKPYRYTHVVKFPDGRYLNSPSDWLDDTHRGRTVPGPRGGARWCRTVARSYAEKYCGKAIRVRARGPK